ncbi:MAG TPA: glycosyltransferase family 2 protein [Anaerolineaceae bacterium]|nr:glycosyltransferase family 2 protein [Anaerolineaceae bacterium]
MKNHHIAVVIPAYKVEKHIRTVVENIPDFVKSIIVVNDGSPDSTNLILSKIADKRLIILDHKENQGVGEAMITGYNQAVTIGAEILVKMDGDDQMDPEKIEELVFPIFNQDADFTKGNRFLHQTQLSSMPLLRRIGNWGLTFLVKAASGYWQIFDPTNGFTAMHANIWKQINQSRIAKDYYFESSLLSEMRFINAVVQDVFIPARYQDEKSSLSIWKVLFSFPLRLLKTTLRRIAYQYYLYNFSFASLALILGTIFILFGFIWGIVYWAESQKTGIPATTGTVLIAVLPIILGMQLLLQAISQDMADIPKKPIQKSLKKN